MVPGGASFQITAVSRVNTVINDFEPVDAMGRQRQEVARELAVDKVRHRLNQRGNRQLNSARRDLATPTRHRRPRLLRP
ncbi:MAG: hypothetical protein ACI8V4_001256 [Ilumatobacter sp.]|jgi:hypothetical protein